MNENTGDKNINAGYKSKNNEDILMNIGKYEISTGEMWQLY